MDRFIDGQCPLEVQRACGLFAEDYHRRQGHCVPLVWNAARPRSDELCPHKTPEGVLGDLVQPDLSANPLRGDSVGSGGRHIGEVHWVGVAEKRPLFVGSGRHERWRCRDQD